MSKRAIIVVTRVAVGGEAGTGDLDPENKPRAQLAGADGIPSEEYVEERFHILERVSATALSKVSVPFDWVWLTCPERHEQVAENAAKLGGHPWVVDQDEEIIEDLLWADEFVTVRLDSDDAILPHAIDALDNLVLPPHSLINWYQGYQLDWGTGQVGQKQWPLRTQGPFLAVNHHSAADMLDFGGPHSYARGDRTLINMDGANFVMTIHDRNQLSRFRPESVLDWEVAGEVLSEFGIGVPINA